MVLQYKGPQRFGAVQAHSFFDPEDGEEILLEEGDPMLPQVMKSVQQGVNPPAIPGAPQAPKPPGIKPPGIAPAPTGRFTPPVLTDPAHPKRDPRPRFAMAAGPEDSGRVPRSVSDAGSFDAGRAEDADQKRQEDAVAARKAARKQEVADDDVVTAESYSGSPDDDDDAADESGTAASGPDKEPTLFESYSAAGGNLLERVPSTPAHWSSDKRAYVGDLETADKLQEEMDQIQSDKLAIAQRENELRENELGNQWLASVERQDILAAKAAEAKSRLTGREAYQKSEMDRLDAIDKKVKEKKVDPRRVFKTGDPMGDLFAALATALVQGAGAYGSALSNSPNYAKQIIDQWMEGDIRAQEEEIDSEFELAEQERSIFARKLKEGGHPDDIRAEIKDLQLGYVEAQLSQVQAESENAHAKTELAKVITGIQEERLKNRQVIVERLGVRYDDKYKQASGGGLRINPIAKELAELDGKLANTAKTRGEAVKTTTAETEKKVEGYGKAVQNLSYVESALARVERVGRQNDDGESIEGIGTLDAFIESGSVASAVLDSEEAAEMKEALDGLNEAFGRLQSQGQIGEKEAATFKKNLAGAFASDRKSFYRQMGAMREMLQGYHDNAAGTYGPEAAREYNRRKKQGQVLRSE